MQFSATEFDNVKFEDICKECKFGQSSGQLVMVFQRVSCSSKQEGTFTTNGIIYIYQTIYNRNSWLHYSLNVSKEGS